MYCYVMICKGVSNGGMSHAFIEVTLHLGPFHSSYCRKDSEGESRRTNSISSTDFAVIDSE